MQALSSNSAWPELAFNHWRDTCATLHRFVQLVGKVRLAATPWVNHSWHATLYLTARGLTTSAIHASQQTFQIDFDFLDQAVVFRNSRGVTEQLPLEAMPVATFRTRMLAALERLEVDLHVSDAPNEIPGARPFSQDLEPRVYDPASAERYWRVLLEVDRVFKLFGTGFIGKESPVHLFWGSFDLAVTRFSGRRAPAHPGGVPKLPDRITREAYSHEVSSAGFWPGDAEHDASFYSYSYPTPPEFRRQKIEPEGARFDDKLGEFVLPYARVREAQDPDRALLAFLQSTYDAAAKSGGWDRAALERPHGQAGVCPSA